MRIARTKWIAVSSGLSTRRAVPCGRQVIGASVISSHVERRVKAFWFTRIDRAGGGRFFLQQEVAYVSAKRFFHRFIGRIAQRCLFFVAAEMISDLNAVVIWIFFSRPQTVALHASVSLVHSQRIADTLSVITFGFFAAVPTSGRHCLF